MSTLASPTGQVFETVISVVKLEGLNCDVSWFMLHLCAYFVEARALAVVGMLALVAREQKSMLIDGLRCQQDSEVDPGPCGIGHRSHHCVERFCHMELECPVSGCCLQN